MAEQLVTVASYSQAYEAHLAKARLEEADIPVFIANEHTISINWLYSNALGGVQLLVPEDRAEEARALLAEDRSQELPVELADPKPCRHCGSYDTEPCTVFKVYAWIPIALSLVVFFLLGPAFILLVFPFFFGAPGVRCHTCGKKSYAGRWPLEKIKLWGAIIAGVLALAFLLQVWLTAVERNFTWEERDWNQDGETTWMEYLESAFVVKVPGAKPDCADYYHRFTREKIKTECYGMKTPRFY